MATQTAKKRIYISVSDEVQNALELLSKETKIPIATTATSLIEKALEIEEDRIWDAIALSRKNEKESLISHEDVWK